MTDGSAYLGSTAFNQSALIEESVSPNTGALRVATELVHLPGICNGIGLTLHLAYSLGAPGNLGLPRGWSFTLPYIVPDATLTIDDQTFIIDPSWQDDAGYMSGLRYQNNHGILFQTVIPPQPLPSGDGAYAYQYNYANGARDYFDATGKLIERVDRFGNAIMYSYTDQLAGVYGNQLATIHDSYGQAIEFSYSSNEIALLLPNGGTIVINLDPNGVASVQAELGAVTSYSYDEQAGAVVLTGIAYPTGLSTEIDYTSIAYATPNGDSAFPAVAALTRYDGAAFANRTRYQYGSLTDNNSYTGYSIGCVLTQANDALMDSNNTSYIYDVTVSIVDSADTLLAYSEYFYNYLHMLIIKNDYLLNEWGALQPCRQTSFTYESTQDAHARTTNYAKPTEILYAAWDQAGSEYMPLRRSIFTYDLFGEPISIDAAMYDDAAQNFVVQSTSTFTYVVTRWGGEMPDTATVLDSVTGNSHTSSYTLTPDELCVARTIQTYRVPGNIADLPWKTRTTNYDAQGRRIEETLAWSDGAPNPAPHLAACTSRYGYSYDSNAHLLTVRSTDALGHIATNVIATAYPNGVIVEAVTPLGAVSRFEYDLLGRLTNSIDPLGHASTLSYSCLQTDGFNRVRNSAASGYVADIYSDGLGRHTRTLDNNGVGSSSTRLLHELTYGPLGNPVRSVGSIGLATVFQYDALGRLVSTTDPHANCTTTVFSDRERVTTVAVNGVILGTTTTDNMGRVVMQTTFACPTDNSINYKLETGTSYDGVGSPILRTVVSVPIAGGSSTPLSAETMRYDADARVCYNKFTGYATTTDSATKQIARDLLGNVVSYTKAIRYGDGRAYDWTSETSAYDECGNLVSRTNAAGQAELYTYNANRRIVSVTRYDGTRLISAYDANSNLVSVSCDGAIRSYGYDIENRLACVSSAGAEIRYTYEADGSPLQTSYPDGRSLLYARDAYGRVTGVTDYTGNTTTIAYGSHGQIVTKSANGCTVTFEYGTVNGAHDMLVGYTLSGSANGSVSTEFDGLGRESKTMATLGGHATMITYLHDAIGRTTGSSTYNPSGTTTTTYAFDGLNQVIAQSATGMQPQQLEYTYDGNTNILSATRNGNVTDYRYTPIDQLVGSGIAYDINGRLTADGTGADYSYDAFDRLLSVTDASRTTNYSYYPDGMLAKEVASQASRTFYYVQGTATQMRTEAQGADQWTAYLFSGKDRVAAFTNDDLQALFLVENGSVGVQVVDDAASALSYAAYGEPHGEIPDFAWKQEYRGSDREIVYLRTRFYHPGLMRFLTMDAFGTSNRYAFADGDPIDSSDPTGHLSEAAALGIGIGVGIVATLVTGGALGAVVGTDIVASIAVGAVAGGVGSVAGDGTSAALNGQSFTAERVGIDFLSGAVGGAVGAGVGGGVGRGCMTMALRGGLSRGAITAIGATSAGLAGGLAGASASSAVTSAYYGQPFFSSATALNMVVGGVGGLGGGLLASGAHFGFGRPGGSGLGVMPIEADPVRSNFNVNELRGGQGGRRVIDFSPSDKDVTAGRVQSLTAGSRDAVVIHGAPRHLFPETDINGAHYTQYMKPEAFADLLATRYNMSRAAGGGDINLYTCYAAKLRLASVAQRLATRLDVNVYAPACRDAVKVSYTGQWIRYTP